MPIHSQSRFRRVTFPVALILTAPLWLTWTAVYSLVRLCHVVFLYAVVWTYWIGRARQRVLFVYSDSPHWKTHVEASILPRLPANAVVLNWSQRMSWQTFSLPVLLFRCFAGEREFNPIGLVFERFKVAKPYRFWRAFRDANHGRPEALQGLEREFLTDVSR